MILSFVLVQLLAGLTAAAHVVYVSPIGNDTWSGSLPDPAPCQCDGPLRTLPHAVQVAAAAGAAELRMRSGTYRLTEVLLIAGISDLLIAPYNGEVVNVSGGQELAGTWARHGPSGLWIMDVSAPRNVSFNQLFRDGAQRLIRAREPEQGDFFTIAANLNGSLANTGFVYQGNVLDFMAHDSLDALAQSDVILYRSWQSSRRSIVKVDPSTHTAMLDYPAGIEPTGNSGGRFIVENLLAAVDSPGEYFMDTAAGTLWYYPLPGEDPSVHVFVAPIVVGDLVRIENCTNVTIAGIAIMHADWDRPHALQHSGNVQAASFLQTAAVHFVGSTKCSLIDTEVAHYGEYGVWFDSNSTGNAVIHAFVHDGGAGGIRVGRGNPLPDEPLDGRSGGNLIDESTVVLGSHVFREGNGVLLQKTSGNELARSEVAFFNAVGVSVGWTWDYQPSEANHNYIHDNHIHHLGNGDLSDLAAIYLLGISPGTIVEHNLVHDTLAFTQYAHGIYLDQAASDILVTMNIAYNTLAASLYQHFGRDNNVTNNIFAYSEGGYGTVWQDADPSFGPSNMTFTHNIVFMDERAGAVFECPYLGNGTFASNVYYNASGSLSASFPSLVPGSCNRSLAEWQAAGQDAGSIAVDPLFADPSVYNFTLSPASPVLALGIKPIPMTGFGPTSPVAWRPTCNAPPGQVFSCGVPIVGHSTIYGADYTCGASVHVACNPGFVAVGPTVPTCGPDGWPLARCLPAV
eukprot:m.124565 g.124565  ORF g.124565 m.124565 type:complete len:740 (+) comp9351_c1_seq1:9-2228(+)